VEKLIYSLIQPNESLEQLQKMTFLLEAHNKRTYLSSVLHVLSLKHLSVSPESSEVENWWKEDAAQVSSVAGLLDVLIMNDQDLRDLSIDWLFASNGGGVGEPIGIRRALVVTLAKDTMILKGLLERSLEQFSDKLWIKHTPILRQEGWFNLVLFHLDVGECSGGGSLLSLSVISGRNICSFFNQLSIPSLK
jgi:telomere length regulation protein